MVKEREEPYIEDALSSDEPAHLCLAFYERISMNLTGPVLPNLDNLASSKPTEATMSSNTFEAPSKSSRSKPKGLTKRNKEFSYSNAVLQALATAVDPQWIEDQLGDEYIGPASPINSSWGAQRVSDKMKILQRANYIHLVNPVHELLNVLSALQKESDESLETVNPYTLQLIVDLWYKKEYNNALPSALGWHEKMMDLLSAPHPRNADQDTDDPIIRALFGIRAEEEVTCKGAKCRGSRRVRSEDGGWSLTVKVPLKDATHSTKSDTSVMALLKTSSDHPDETDKHECKHCGVGVKAKVVATGYTHLPENLVIDIQYEEPRRSGRSRSGTSSAVGQSVNASIELSPLIDLSKYARDQSSSYRYKLQTIIKQGERGGNENHYRAFTRTSDGVWWRCDEHFVIKSDHLSAHSPDMSHGGHPCLLFYEKVHETLTPQANKSGEDTTLSEKVTGKKPVKKQDVGPKSMSNPGGKIFPNLRSD